MKKAFLIALLFYAASVQAQTNKGVLVHGINNGLWVKNGNIGIGNTTPVWGLDVKRTIGANKDSITHQTTNGAREMLVQDTSTGQFQRMPIPSGTSDLTGAAIKTNIHVVSDADYTIASTDYAVVYSTMSADRTLTLPSASGNTNRMLVLRHGGGAFSLNLSVAIREDSSVTVSILGNNESVTVISDGTDWWIVAHGT